MWKAVIFDVDGTLLDTERIYMEAWRKAGRMFGITINEDVLLRTRAIPSSEGRKIFEEALGPAFDYEKVQPERVRIAEELIARTSPDTLCLPGARKILRDLKECGVRMAVASSTSSQKTVAHLAHAGLLHYFGAVIGGDMVERGKPNPDIFWKAADRLGVPYEQCLVVGDTPADVKAATAAGMQVVLIPDQVPANEETTTLSLAVLEDLNGVLPYFM